MLIETPKNQHQGGEKKTAQARGQCWTNISRLKTPEGASSGGLDSVTLKPLSVLVSKYPRVGEGKRESRGRDTL